MFCVNNGIKHVPEFYVGPKSGFDSNFYMDKRYHDMGLNSPQLSDPNTVDEGVCIRLDDNFTPHFYKHKAPFFYLHESVDITKNIVDIETIESE